MGGMGGMVEPWCVCVYGTNQGLWGMAAGAHGAPGVCMSRLDVVAMLCDMFATC
jgi:hypothetical protein